MPKNKRRIGNDSYSKITKWLKKQNKKRLFSVRDIVKELPIKKSVVSVFLCRLAQRKYLKKDKVDGGGLFFIK